MSQGKWLSLAVGAVAAVLVALAHSGMMFGQPHGQVGALIIAVGALAVGMALAFLHSLFTSRLEAELLHLVGHIESLGRTGLASSWRPRLGLAPLAEAAERSVANLRKRAEQLVVHRRELEVRLRLAEAERDYAHSILNAIADAVIVTDAFNEVLVANDIAARALGFDQRQALRRPVEEVVRDERLIQLIKETRESGDPSLRRHVEHVVGRNGQSIVYDVSLAALRSRPGRAGGADDHGASHEGGSDDAPAGVVTVLRDITREKVIAEMKTEFVSNVSHELRTPLSSIKAYVEMLVDGEARDEQTRAEFYNIIQGETNRLQRLIDNILNISRIEAGVVKVQREYIALPQVISEVVEVMRPQARAKQIELAEVPAPLFFQVFADKDMIYQATLNLIGNAIKYTPAEGKVTIAVLVDDEDQTVRVEVRDSGVGIPPQDLPHLFDKFYRVQDHKKIAKGTGLGLNLVKQIVETVHGGELEVSSEVGKGSVFSFSLPLADNGF